MKTEKIPEASENRLYLWKFRREDIIVPGNEIIYLHTQQRKVWLHTVNGVFRVRGPLKEAVREVEDLPMVKVHSSYLVHIDYLQRLGPRDVLLKNGETLPVSVRCRRRLKPVLEAYIEEKGWKNPLT